MKFLRHTNFVDYKVQLNYNLKSSSRISSITIIKERLSVVIAGFYQFIDACLSFGPYRILEKYTGTFSVRESKQANFKPTIYV